MGIYLHSPVLELVSENSCGILPRVTGDDNSRYINVPLLKSSIVFSASTS